MSDEQSIRDLIALWHSASVRGDVETVLGLMSDDVVFLVAGKPPMRGRSRFESDFRKLLETHRFETRYDVKEVKVSGDMAYSWSEFDVRIMPISGGDANVRAGSVLSVFRKVDGKWILVRDANLLGPA